MLLPGRALALFLSAAVMLFASALVTPVTLEVLYMKLDVVPVPFMNWALGPLLLLAWLPTAAAVVVAVLLLPSLQLPGSMLLPDAACWDASNDGWEPAAGRQLRWSCGHSNCTVRHAACDSLAKLGSMLEPGNTLTSDV